MRYIERKGKFKRQYKLMLKRGKSEKLIQETILKLAQDIPLPPANEDHPLKGSLNGFRDCHIQPDWVLIYQKEPSEDGRGILWLDKTGTHSDIFG